MKRPFSITAIRSSVSIRFMLNHQAACMLGYTGFVSESKFWSQFQCRGSACVVGDSTRLRQPMPRGKVNLLGWNRSPLQIFRNEYILHTSSPMTAMSFPTSCGMYRRGEREREVFRQSVSLEKEHEGKNQHVMCLTDRNGTYNHKINIRERGPQEQLIRNRWSKSLLTASTRRTADGFLQTHHGCVLCRVRVSFAVAGLRACGSPIFGPVRNRVMLRLTVLFCIFCRSFLQQKYYRTYS